MQKKKKSTPVEKQQEKKRRCVGDTDKKGCTDGKKETSPKWGRCRRRSEGDADARLSRRRRDEAEDLIFNLWGLWEEEGGEGDCLFFFFLRWGSRRRRRRVGDSLTGVFTCWRRYPLFFTEMILFTHPRLNFRCPSRKKLACFFFLFFSFFFSFFFGSVLIVFLFELSFFFSYQMFRFVLS